MSVPTKNNTPQSPTDSGFEKFDPDKPENKEREIKDAPKQEETVVESVAEQLHVDLPQVNIPLPMKLIALLTLIGGLSTLASTFTGIFSATEVTASRYILNVVAGVLFIAISYGLIKRQNWATWLYGLIVIVGLFINWAFSILPALIVIYLIINRKYLYPSIFDKLVTKLSHKLSKQMK